MRHASPARGVSLRALLGKHWWAQRRVLLQAYVATLVSVLCVAIAPWPLQAIIDGVIAGHGLSPPVSVWLSGWPAVSLVVLLATTIAVVALFGAVASAAEKNLNARIRERMTLALRDDLIAHLQQLALAFDTATRNGELALRLVDDVQQVVRLLTKTLPLIVRHLGVTVALLVVMYSVDPALAAIALAILLPLVLLSRHYARRLQRAAHAKREQEGAVAGLAQEIMRGLPNSQSPAAVRRLREAFAGLNARSLQAGVEETRVAVALERAMQTANGVALACVAAAGALLVLDGLLSLGELTVFIAYMNQLFKPVDKINELATNVSRALVRAARLQDLFNRSPLVSEPAAPRRVTAPRGQLSLRGVDFAYGSAEGARTGACLFTGLEFEFTPGHLYVLTGASGSGKSTLFRLLTRMLDPVAGELRFDGVPYRELGLDDLRRQFAVVDQHTHLFAGSLRDALSPADATPDEATLARAITAVGLEGFVAALPQGLDTMLSEDGLNLSGGQRTRLAIARAMLSTCPVLLFDEPLANVDAMSRRVILDNLRRLALSRTCIAITHEATLVECADCVLTLAGGGMQVEHRVAGPRLPRTAT
ncbi:MAG: ABC transporter ATP-binding protein [Gammaproteobacteria bacterium]